MRICVHRTKKKNEEEIQNK